ncbi:TerC family protein [Aquimarina litoralis]|uniref:TerC family protein n=1 Tax=Aquimarina litoralis TaxID=584605 RepID=A0ABN1IMB5_9FLAO
MEQLFTVESLVTLLMLVLLQAVLGFDNLLYISLESKKAPPEKQSFVRKMGVGLAIILRIVLLFVLMSLIQYFQEPFLSLHDNGILEFNLNVHSLIVLAGGVFIIYTAIKEIWHMMLLKEHEETDKEDKKGSINKVILWIVIMNLVFSFDSILSAMALTSDMDYVPQLILMSIAIILGGVLMIVLADKVSNFLQKNRMYEVLGLFILFIVGIMLLSEGGHLAHLHIFNNEVTQMSKTTFYFVIVVLVIVDIVQGRYQKKLLTEKEHQEALAEKESKDLLADQQEK